MTQPTSSKPFYFSWPALCGYGLALVFALPSLGYPLGGDAAIYAHVGDRWLDGAWPYRDVFDHKPPGIYFIHLLNALFTGGQSWGVRCTDLVAVLGIGALLGPIIGGRFAREWGGIAAMVCAGVYYTWFDFWTTAQTEIWVGLCLVAGWAAAVRPGPDRLWSAVAGSCLSLACLFKLTAVVPGVLVVALVAFQPWLAGASEGRARRGVFRVALCVGAAAAVALAAWGLFAIGGAGADLWQAVFVANMHYATVQFFEIENAEFWLRQARIVAPLSLLAWLAGMRGLLRNGSLVERVQGIAVFCFFLFAFNSLSIQGKQLAYHWAVLVPFFVGMWMIGIAAVCRDRPDRGWLLSLGFVGLTVVANAPPRFFESDHVPVSYPRHVSNVAAYLVGQTDRATFVAPYRFRYAVADAEACRQEILDLGPATATVCLNGTWMPGVFVETDFRCSSRFFMDHVLDYLAPEHRPPAPLDQWPNEHREAFNTRPPDFVISEAGQPQAATTVFLDHTYRPVTACGTGWLYQRVSSAPN